jgi:hypothetical protein
MRRTLILSGLVAALVGIGASTAAADRPDTGYHGNQTNDCAARDARGRNLQVVGLVADGSLVCFRENRPDRARPIGKVSGLQQDTSLVGIDYRPANNLLYGVGNQGGIYTIDVNTGAAKLASRLVNTTLSGASFGVDFNPSVDRLRIVSDTGQNLAVNVDDGTVTPGGTLNIPGATPVNPALGINGAAYTNNDADPNTVTTLFDIEATNDQVAVQAPPGAGSLNPTGKLGIDAGNANGFDIYSTLGDGTTVANRALLSVASSDGYSATLYGVDVLTGRASKVGHFGQAVVDIAFPTDQR